MDLSDPSKPLIATVRDSRRILQMVNFVSVETGEPYSLDGNAHDREVAAVLLNIFGKGEPRQDMGWQVQHDLFCVRLIDRESKLPWKVTREEIETARKLSTEGEDYAYVADLERINRKLRLLGFGYLRRVPSGEFCGVAPQAGAKNRQGARVVFCRVIGNELRPQIEPEAYMEGSVQKAKQHVERIAKEVEQERESNLAVASETIPELLSRIVRLLGGAPFDDVVAGSRITVIPMPTGDYVELPPTLNIAKALDSLLLYPLVKKRVEAQEPLVYYELITKLLGVRLDPSSVLYKTTVMQAFSRSFREVKRQLKGERIYLDREQPRRRKDGEGNLRMAPIFRKVVA